MISVRRPLFKLGAVVATPGAIAALEKAGQQPWELLARHVQGDWGVVGAEDAEANNAALRDGSRLLSAYVLKTGEKLWVISEAEDDHGNRASSAILTPEEY
jgi:hypothetical protein